ncbi:MAG TPA: zf-HC2 domain-containing protein [Anaeromyxobacteraceae bacterium]|nr:zf-HC2 domain-containing protein [Anaeromyxobacteraceae bacterium]
MTGPCPKWEPLLLDRVAGELDAESSRRLDEHLAACAACRAESAALAETLSLAELPPPSEAEKAALAGAHRSALTTWKQSVRRRRSFAAATAALAVAAAAAAFVLAPGLARRAPDMTAPPAAWEVPDLEEAWSVAEIASPSGDAADEAPAGTAESSGDDVLFAELEDVELDSQ